MTKNSRWEVVFICRRRCGVWTRYPDFCCPKCGGDMDWATAEVFVRRRSGWRGKLFRMTYRACPAAKEAE